MVENAVFPGTHKYLLNLCTVREIEWNCPGLSSEPVRKNSALIWCWCWSWTTGYMDKTEIEIFTLCLSSAKSMRTSPMYESPHIVAYKSSCKHHFHRQAEHQFNCKWQQVPTVEITQRHGRSFTLGTAWERYRDHHSLRFHIKLDNFKLSIDVRLFLKLNNQELSIYC